MAAGSAIEWTEATWNPVTGCTMISPGCAHCYAARMAKRLQAMGHPNYRNGFDLTTHPHVLQVPLAWRKPRMIFVNSMSDLFHKDVPLTFIKRVFAVMREAHWHTFQILTKRSERLLELNARLEWPSNVWMGVSFESQRYVHRIEQLRCTDAHVKFLSLEPLLGPLLDWQTHGIDWVIVGGESGPRSRPMQAKWARDIRDTCVRDGVPFFFKQWGGFMKKRTGRTLDGRTWDEMPAGPRHGLSLPVL